MAKIHQEALAACMPPELLANITRKTLKRAETFFLETLSPFEVTHRGFREANLKLRELIEMLEQRNIQLANTNRSSSRKLPSASVRNKPCAKARTLSSLFGQARVMEENMRQLSNRICTCRKRNGKESAVSCTTMSAKS